jgi:uncharacterized membrane protein YecN with MAPEG domain
LQPGAWRASEGGIPAEQAGSLGDHTAMLPVTLTFAGAAALLNIWLAIRIVQIRRSGKVLVGDGENRLLLCRMRAQANFIEYAPFVLILMGLLELAGEPKGWLRAIGFVFIAARLAHPFGMDMPKPHMLRMIGALVTWVVLIVLGLWAIWIGAHPPEAVHYL